MSQGALAVFDGPGSESLCAAVGHSKLRAYFTWKTFLDRIAAALLLIPGLPLIGFLVVLIRLTSRGPGIYSQERVGKGGRIYTMYKLRSMRSDAETATGPVWSIPGCDPRVTPLGYWLRKLHLDELPQLFNVLKGEMSLIGPRPERPWFVKQLAEQIPNYTQRLRILPGVTGMAQINLPPDTDLDSVRRKLVLDLEYVEKAGVMLDCRILLCTLLRIVGLSGETAMRLMRLRRTVTLGNADEPPTLRVIGFYGDEEVVESTPPEVPSTRLLNAFTVDVEDYFQVSAFERGVARTSWADFDSRVVANTQRTLSLLAEKNVHGTFFILGWVAQRFPSLVREIASAGHELGSHSYWHRLVYTQTPDEFRQDLRDSLAAIEDAAGVRVSAYRAPSFSITTKSLWALEILAEEGIRIDSSIFPVRRDRYGIPGARRDIHDLSFQAGSLCEFPMTVAPCLGVNVPVGGGYFRLYPTALTHYLLNEVQNKRRPFMFYIHPWELDPDQPRISCGTRLSRFRHYVSLSQTERKLSQLVDTFRFGTVSESIAEHRGASESVAASPPESPAAAEPLVA